MNNLAVRAASGLVFAIIMIGGILWTHLSFMAVMLLILAGSVREYFIITSSKREHGTRFSGNGLIAFFVCVHFPVFVYAAVATGAGLAQWQQSAQPALSGGDDAARCRYIVHSPVSHVAVCAFYH
jgi:hypothetical protein